MAFVHNLPQLRLQSVTSENLIPDLDFLSGTVKLRMEGGGKQRRFTVLAGLYDHDFIGEIFRLLLRYSHLCKIAGDYLFQKKNCSEYLPGEV